MKERGGRNEIGVYVPAELFVFDKRESVRDDSHLKRVFKQVFVVIRAHQTPTSDIFHSVYQCVKVAHSQIMYFSDFCGRDSSSAFFAS